MRESAASSVCEVQLRGDESGRCAYWEVQWDATMIEAARKLLESTERTSTAMQRGFERGAVTKETAETVA